MSQKILVAYATRAGSTAEVAATIGQVLNNHGVEVDVLPVKNVTDISAYRAVVIGSAVRFGQWLPEAVKFLEQNSAALNDKPTALFTVHIMNLADNETSQVARQAYLDPVHKLVTPRVEVFFAGSGDPSKLSFVERLIGKMVKSPQDDLRDWTVIRGWAESLVETL